MGAEGRVRAGRMLRSKASCLKMKQCPAWCQGQCQTQTPELLVLHPHCPSASSRTQTSHSSPGPPTQSLGSGHPCQVCVCGYFLSPPTTAAVTQGLMNKVHHDSKGLMCGQQFSLPGDLAPPGWDPADAQCSCTRTRRDPCPAGAPRENGRRAKTGDGWALT